MVFSGLADSPERKPGEFRIVEHGTGDPVMHNIMLRSDAGELFLDEETQKIIGQIPSGEEIESRLIELAKIGGIEIDPTPEQSERYATNRLALSETDYEARRTYIQPMMAEAGLEVEEHPLADIGILPGNNRDLPPLVLASHTDTVPSGDMYDGVYGVISAIETIKAMQEIGFTPDRDIIVLSYTGEESSRFGMACFGSRSIYHGLTEEQLASRESLSLGGKSIGEVLGPEQSKNVKEPLFGEGRRFKTPYAVLELHVEQSDLLEKNKIDIGIVENIAAPARFKVKIGEDEPLEPREAEHEFVRYFEIDAMGIANHSGATPMGPESRADGLVWTSAALEQIIIESDSSGDISIGTINVDSSAINKIPGLARTKLRLSAATNEELQEILSNIEQILNTKNSEIINSVPAANGVDEPLKITEVKSDEIVEKFFDVSKIINRQKSALMLIKAVEEICSIKSDSGVVGTVGHYNMNDEGIIDLLLDIRGLAKEHRESAVEEIQRTFTNYFRIFSKIDFGQRLQGSLDPTRMFSTLVNHAKRTACVYDVGTMALMDSVPVHDVANSSSAGIASGLFFVPSRGGIAHNPNAYTSPEHLEKGAKLLGGMALGLSRDMEVFEYLPKQEY